MAKLKQGLEAGKGVKAGSPIKSTSVNPVLLPALSPISYRGRVQDGQLPRLPKELAKRNQSLSAHPSAAALPESLAQLLNQHNSIQEDLEASETLDQENALAEAMASLPHRKPATLAQKLT